MDFQFTTNASKKERMNARQQQPIVQTISHEALQFILQGVSLKHIQRRKRDTHSAALRQEESLPILTSLQKWMTEAYMKVLPKSAIGKALGYSL